MVFYALIGGMALLVVLMLLLKTNTAVVFFSLCAGSVLVNYGGNTVVTLANSFSANGSELVDSCLQIGLLVLPAIVSIFLLRKSFKGGKLVLFALPAVAVSLTAILLIVPMLPAGVHHNAVNTQVWIQVDRYRDFIILASFLVSLIVLWIGKPKKEKGKHK